MMEKGQKPNDRNSDYMNEECIRVKDDLEVSKQHMEDCRNQLEELNKNLREMEEQHKNVSSQFE